jgi:hypothetical protein
MHTMKLHPAGGPDSSYQRSGSGVFTRDTLVKGKPARIECIEVRGQTFSIERGPVTIVRLEDEWYEDLKDPDSVLSILSNSPHVKPDIFSFWQRLPDLAPKYPFHLEWDHIAALPIPSYQEWFDSLKPRLRTSIRKAEKEGIVVRETEYDDDFVRGMTAIFNEAPIRQGRPFWHYGKDFATVKEQFSRYLSREYMIGAYYQDQMIGFIMLGNAGRFGLTGQIISSLHHRDKATNNALIAGAVRACERRHLPYLVYLFWSDDSLSEFKRRCGFQKLDAPRYYVPLTWKGKLALNAGAHRGWRAMIPDGLKMRLKNLRRTWYEREQRSESLPAGTQASGGERGD